MVEDTSVNEEQRNEIAEYLYNEIDDCDSCPLEKICDEHCKDMWAKFLASKNMVNWNLEEELMDKDFSEGFLHDIADLMKECVKHNTDNVNIIFSFGDKK